MRWDGGDVSVLDILVLRCSSSIQREMSVSLLVQVKGTEDRLGWKPRFGSQQVDCNGSQRSR